MNYKKAKKLLKKINLYLETEEDWQDISSIEKALLKQHLMDLYDGLFYENEQTPRIKVETPTPKKEEKVTTPMEIPEVIEEKKEPEMPVQKVEQPKIPVNENGDQVPDIEDIFKWVEITQVSEKLSFSPVKDISKAIGINERVFTIRELFGGDDDLFKTTLEYLNAEMEYENAKQYMIKELAIPLKWDAPEMKKKATQFARLVQRKFR